MPSSTINSLELEQLQERLRAMPDAELMKFTEAATMCSSHAKPGTSSREEFAAKSREARAEWNRRHPKAA